MVGQKILISALVASFLVIQLVQFSLAKPAAKEEADREGIQFRKGTGTRSQSGTETDEDDEDGGMPAMCAISAINFVIGQFNTLFPGAISGVPACSTLCDVGAAECAACILSLIPPIPTIPTDLAGCS